MTLAAAADAWRWYSGLRPAAAPCVCTPLLTPDGLVQLSQRRAPVLDLSAGMVVRLDSRPAPGRRQPGPAVIERQYRRLLLRRVNSLSASVEAALRPTLRRMHQQERGRRADSAADVRALLAALAVFGRSGQAVPDSLASTAAQLVQVTQRQVDSQLSSLIDLDLSTASRASDALIDQWVSDNVALISSLDSRYLADVKRAVKETVGQGGSTQSLVTRLQRRAQVSQSRARLIAEDQIGSLQAAATQQRQRSVGIVRYRWSSSGDGRVRPEHRALDGTIRRWDRPHPTEGHPGQSIRCRCVALPVI